MSTPAANRSAEDEDDVAFRQNRKRNVLDQNALGIGAVEGDEHAVGRIMRGGEKIGIAVNARGVLGILGKGDPIALPAGEVDDVIETCLAGGFRRPEKCVGAAATRQPIGAVAAAQKVIVRAAVDDIRTVTAEQVRDAAQKWLDKKRSVTGYLIKDQAPRREEKRS